MPWIARKDWDRILTLVENLSDHRSRMDRLEHGVPEAAPIQKKPLPPMPAEVRMWVNSHDGPFFRDEARKDAQRAASEAGSWEPVLERIAEEEG